MGLLALGIEAIERGLMPDRFSRMGIRRLCVERLRRPAPAEGPLIASMYSGPIARIPRKANEQHYELPVDFFTNVLGRRLKYSCCYWPRPSMSLDAAEQAALEMTCERAGLSDGQDILELGCGWGSLSLWMAERYPNCRITAVSNSNGQRQFIEREARAFGLGNLRVVTADVNDFGPADLGRAELRFDRVVSVEMFEHMWNYDQLLSRIASWLAPGGKVFVHIFCHDRLVYPFESDGDANWMGRYFFSGGIMPSADLLRRFDRDLQVTRSWKWNGRHYRRTAEAWLANLDARRDQVQSILGANYGDADARRWLNRWRMFFLAVSELFGFADGNEWFVSHYELEHLG
jgi:cyclopropane-fatty-acyl-phospholipid synthase